MTEFGEKLLSEIMKTFSQNVGKDKKLKQIANRIRDGTSYETANEYSIRIGEIMSESILKHTNGIAFISEEVANEILPPVMTAGHNLISEAAAVIQSNMNAADQVGLGVLSPDLDTNRIAGIVEKVSSYDTFAESEWVLKEPIINYAQSVVDQAIRKNAASSGKVGLKSYIIRKAEPGACKWCLALAGKYEYPDVPQDVYRRHDFCRCTVTFARGKNRQNVWNKEEWSEAQAEEQIEAVKTAEKEKEPKPIPDNDISRKLGDANYRAIDEKVTETGGDFEKYWRKYEDKIQISDYKSKGRAYAQGDAIHFDLASEIKPTRADKKPFQTFFHESNHAIDYIAARENGMYGHFSAHYKNHLFPETIVNEVQELVKDRGEMVKRLIKQKDVQALRDLGVIDDFSWNYTYGKDISKVKYSKSMAYNALQKEVWKLSDAERGDLSDILEGATNGTVCCGYGHGKSYWKQRTYAGVRDGLATEAFAEMNDSTFANPESLATIQKYLPKSYKVFEEMIEYLAK